MLLEVFHHGFKKFPTIAGRAKKRCQEPFFVWREVLAFVFRPSDGFQG